MTNHSRSNYIPDNYVGDTHLTNWFRKHLQMYTLWKVFIEDHDCRGHVSKKSIHFNPSLCLYLQFEDGKVTTIASSEYLSMIDEVI